LVASLAMPAVAQSSYTVPAGLEQNAGGLPVWGWIAIVVVALLLLALAAAARRKRRQAVIKTRIG
jgi:TRAP-type mannitol/chloroaromatic compound transport system permease small subunit